MLDDLYKYRKLSSNLRDMEMEKNYLYYNIQSPNFSNDTHSTSPSDPTSITVAKIEKLNQMITQRKLELFELLKKIEEFLDGIESAEVRTIIRMYFIDGFSWKKVSLKMYGINDYYCARKKFMRYVGKEK